MTTSGKHWRLGGGVIMHHDKCRPKQCREKVFFPTLVGVIGLQVQDDLERTSPSRPARE